MSKRECLYCGMITAVSVPEFDAEKMPQYCSKCDEDLLAQTDMSRLTDDIAHHQETITQALSKLDQRLNEGYAGYYEEVYLVVGGGQIKEEVLKQLHYYALKGYILAYAKDRQNPGAIIVKIRNAE